MPSGSIAKVVLPTCVPAKASSPAVTHSAPVYRNVLSFHASEASAKATYGKPLGPIAMLIAETSLPEKPLVPTYSQDPTDPSYFITEILLSFATSANAMYGTPSLSRARDIVPLPMPAVPGVKNSLPTNSHTSSVALYFFTVMLPALTKLLAYAMYGSPSWLIAIVCVAK